jgi:integrase
MLPKYSRHATSGQAKVKYRGKVTYLGPYGSAESHQRYAQLVAEIKRRQEDQRAKVVYSLPSDPLLVGEIVLKYHEHCRIYYRSPDGSLTGESETARHCLKYLTDLFAELPVDQLGPLKLRAVQDGMIAKDRSRQYINKAIGHVRRCFKWAVSQELCAPSVVQALATVPPLRAGRTRAKENPAVQPVPVESIDAVWPYLSKNVQDVIVVMRMSAARPGEVLAMTPDQIDRSTWKYYPASHKNAHRSRPRIIDLNPTAQAVILPRLLRCKPGERLFKINRTSLRDLINRACKKAGVTPWHPNMIRHRVGTDIRASDGLEAAQCLLGHSRADVTQLYAERNERLAAELVRKLG